MTILYQRGEVERACLEVTHGHNSYGDSVNLILRAASFMCSDRQTDRDRKKSHGVTEFGALLRPGLSVDLLTH